MGSTNWWSPGWRVDVATASDMACVRVPREGVPGRFPTKMWPVETTTTATAVAELADHLVVPATNGSLLGRIR